MKPAIEAAFWNGVRFGAWAILTMWNALSTLDALAAGELLAALFSGLLAGAMSWMARREWQEYRAHLETIA